MSSGRDRWLLIGIVVGGVGGFILGSVLAMQLGGRTLQLVRRVVDRLLRHGPAVRFDLLLQ